MKDIKPKGKAVFMNREVPVTWSEETYRYVYDVKRMKEVNGKWIVHKRNFDDKMDKEEIIEGSFREEYIPKKIREKHHTA